MIVDSNQAFELVEQCVEMAVADLKGKPSAENLRDALRLLKIERAAGRHLAPRRGGSEDGMSEIERLREALLDATANLAAAASAHRTYARRHQSIRPRAVTDALFRTRADDFDRAVARARAALKVSNVGT